MSNLDQPTQLALPVSNNAMDVVHANASMLRNGFAAWLSENGHVWRRFEQEADEVWNRGRRHYSARTIVEVLRHESALREKDPVFKLNDHKTPDMARLYRLLHPQRADLFETRVQRGADRAA